MLNNVERQRKHFDSIADTYYTARRHSNHQLVKSLMWNGFFRDWRQPPGDNVTVLEAMCGFAEGKQIIENGLGRRIQYSGFDYSQNVISKLKFASPELDVECADVTKYQPVNTYDIVMLLGGLHHVPEHAGTVVMGLTSALRRGGYFINLEPTNGNSIARMVRERIYERNSLFDEKTERAFDVDTLFSFFQNAGLSLSKVMYPGLLSYVLYYNPDAFPSLNLGGERCVRAAFAADRLFFRTALGRILSFATLTAWRKE
jgi:SAM-dependent methyltransferase